MSVQIIALNNNVIPINIQTFLWNAKINYFKIGFDQEIKLAVQFKSQMKWIYGKGSLSTAGELLLPQAGSFLLLSTASCFDTLKSFRLLPYF